MGDINLGVPEGDLKNLVKIALEELIREKPELFKELIIEIIEEIALAKAIEEGLNTPEVSEKEVMDILNSDAV
jgi:predicted HTH domain antitoxin